MPTRHDLERARERCVSLHTLGKLDARDALAARAHARHQQMTRTLVLDGLLPPPYQARPTTAPPLLSERQVSERKAQRMLAFAASALGGGALESLRASQQRLA